MGSAAKSSALAWGRLLRASLAPSALADIAAGCVLVSGAWPEGVAPFVVMLGSACVYHGGMALNDWADRAEDARTRPGRPIPSGAIPSGAALGVALGLLALGPALALAAALRAGLVLGAVALAAALYDLAGRGPWRGPLLLGLCRAGNLSAGIALASSLPWRAGLWLAPAVYGLYVFLVSRLARLEDVDPRAQPARELRPAGWVWAAALVLLASASVASHLGHRSPLAEGAWLVEKTLPIALVVFGAIGLFPGRELSGRPWTSQEIQRMTGSALRRLLVCTAALACGGGTWTAALVAFAILLGYPLAFALRRAFPPT